MSRRRAPPPDEAKEAFDKYVEFHRYEPKAIGSFPSSFAIPTRLRKAGRSKYVTYESSKVDPATLRRPRRPVSYIHDHDAGVHTYLPEPGGDQVDVPKKFLHVPALTRLGYCLGYCFTEDGDDVEAEARRPYPDLYTVPGGQCLLVIQSRRKVLAMMWGGALGVFARGIDG